MTRRILILAGATFLLGSLDLALVNGKSYARKASPGGDSSSYMPFTIANVHFEQNAANEDFEMVFEAKGDSEGLAKLTVVSPDGRAVVDFTAPTVATLGVRQLRCEFPVPREAKSLESAYPEGIYTFDGTTASGDKLHGQDTLNHQLPAPTSFLHPEIEAAGVAIKNLQITWMPVKNLSAYIIYIEQTEDKAVNITAKLHGTVAAFDVPDGFLLPGTEYKLSIGTVTDKGNISFVETTFFTTKRE
jgi:hypothetical protein